MKDVTPAISSEKWQRKPYTRKELNDLCLLTNDMDETEIKRRIAATTFGNKPWAYFELNGEKFYLKSTEQ